MNDWALILGASSGIGAACAKALAKKEIPKKEIIL